MKARTLMHMKQASDDPGHFATPAFGTYLMPQLQTHYDRAEGGTLITIGACTRGLDAALVDQLRLAEQIDRSGSAHVVMRVKPVYATDALKSANWRFAISALQEFVALCIQFHPDYEEPKTPQKMRW